MTTHPFDQRQSPAGSAAGAIIEIRAGVGGREAALFAAELAQMYTRYAQRRGWAVETIERSESPDGGLREVVLRIRSGEAHAVLAPEAGVHCIQRVSPTDRRRRVHTSTATVAVLREPSPAELTLRPEDLWVETMRARGHGGQGVNTTDSAVRVTHLPTGVTAACQDERSQQQNRETALAVLRTRVLEQRAATADQERHAERRRQVQGGERAERRRTYDMPEDRIIDRATGRKIRRVQRVLDGDLDLLLGA